MKRTVNLTFEFDDAPYIDPETREVYPADPIAFAMDMVNAALSVVFGDFVEARLDEELLADGNGNLSDEAKLRALQRHAFEKALSRHREE